MTDSVLSERFVPRLYEPAFGGQDTTFELSPENSRYVTSVLRARVGDRLALFNGLDGFEYEVELEWPDKKASRVCCVHSQEMPSEAHGRTLTLYQGLCRGQVFDSIIQQATELGVEIIQPLYTQKSHVSPKSLGSIEKRLDRWRQVAVAAACQSGRVYLPEIRLPLPVMELHPVADEYRLGFDPRASRRLGSLPEEACDSVGVMIGPESGWSVEERDWLGSQGVQLYRLGPRVLRAETAALVALAGVQVMLGDF